MSNIHESIKNLAMPIEKLIPLDGNPRKGNVDAIMASYKEFGQVKPVVVRANADGTYTVIAGNHQVEACRRLGWSEVACVEFDGDDARAVAFALADNRTTELGTVDNNLLFEMIANADDYADLFESLGWDEFEFASMEDDYVSDDDTTYTPPVLVSPVGSGESASPVVPLTVVETAEGAGVVAPASTDVARAVVQGSGTVVGGANSKAVVQYTLVFESAEQQRKWYDFIRWLRTAPSYDGDTTAERLLSFLDSHADYE